MPTIAPDILRQVKALEIRSRGLVSTLFAGATRSVFRGQGMEFAEVRAYEYGDDVRSIDWNVSARLGTPYVKTFTEERELTVFLVVDASGSTRVGSPRAKGAIGTEIAAVVALAAAFQQERVGALLFSDRVDRVVPPRKGRTHAMRILRELLAVSPRGSSTDLAGSLEHATRLLRHRAIVVVLSDFLAPAWERPLRRLGARHDVLAIVLEEPRDSEPPAGRGWLDLEDAERGRRVVLPLGRSAARTRLARVATERRVAREAALRAAGVRVLVVRTGDDYATALRRALGGG